MASYKYVGERDGTTRGNYSLLTDAGAEIEELQKPDAA